MTRCHTATANKRPTLRVAWSPSSRLGMRIAALVFFAGVLSAAGTVAAAREPDPQAAYGPPPTPVASSSTAVTPRTVASSWSMAPLPEEEGGVAISATSMSPITEASAMQASPQ